MVIDASGIYCIIEDLERLHRRVYSQIPADVTVGRRHMEYETAVKALEKYRKRLFADIGARSDGISTRY